MPPLSATDASDIIAHTLDLATYLFYFWDEDKNQSCLECPGIYFGFGICWIWQKNFKMTDFGNFGGHVGVLGFGLTHSFPDQSHGYP